MKTISSNWRVRFSVQVLGACVGLACASADPVRTQPTPAATERVDPGSPASDCTIDRDASPSDSLPKTTGTTDARDSGLARVVGYLPTYRPLDPCSLHLDALTHLVIAFAVPSTDAAGSPFEFEYPVADTEIATLITAAHKQDVKVLAAIGGGAGGARVTKALKSDSVAVVRSSLAFLNRYGFDGLDIDIEGDAIDPASFEELVLGLDTIIPQGKLLTAAVNNYRRENYRALDRLSFLNIMSYDQCGSQSGHCEHSTYAQAERDLEFWSSEYWETAGGTYDEANVVLGVPFYGHCSGTGCAVVTNNQPDIGFPTYAQVSAFWSKSHSNSHEPVPDEVEDDTRDYYVSLNGPQTIERKTRLAKNYGGIMIWELGQDAAGSDSLLAAIKGAE